MTVSQNKNLQKSIWGLIAIYYTVESASFFIVARFNGFSLVFFSVFMGVHTVFSIIVGIFLVINKKLFFIIKTKEPLYYVNLACGITLFRITMIPSVFFLILALKNYPVGPVLAPYIALTCLSDIFDGYVSRRNNEETLIGRILDSSSDYLLLGVVAIAYYLYGLLAPWLFWLIVGRLFLHSLGMMILLLLKRKLIPQTTIFGKIAVAACMVLFVYKPVALIFPILNHAALFVEACAGILFALSLVDKVIYFVRGIRGNSKSQNEDV